MRKVPPMTTPLRGRDVIAALIKAGILREEDRIQRVVIDIAVDRLVVVHVQHLGDTRILDVIATLNGVEIRHAA